MAAAGLPSPCSCLINAPPSPAPAYRYPCGMADPEVTGTSTWLGGLIGPQAKVGLKAVAFDAAGAVGGGALGLAASGGDRDVALQYAGYGQVASLDSWGDLDA
jgi:hypothetical protein